MKIRVSLIAVVFVLQFFSGSLLKALRAEEITEDCKYVFYSDFGAKGDGSTDDMEAIVKAHAYANRHGLAVKADDEATYYIGGEDKTAVIQTDTDFGKARFIIDDRSLENRRSSVFVVSSKHKVFDLEGVISLEKNQPKLDVSLPGRCLVTVENSNVKNYIRFGLNQNKGSALTDIFLADSDGMIDTGTPILCEFEEITGITARRVDMKPLTVSGGHFTTIANQAESEYNYHSRGIGIRRSNVEVVGLEHYVKGEGEHGAPYGGFVNIRDCANVTVRDAMLTGHKRYYTIGRAGLRVPMGSYDITANKAVNVSFINCRQSNDIKDRQYWGIMASNYCKNLVYDECVFSRFDAHKGVYNATIRNSKIGYMSIKAIGHGTLMVENTTVYGRRFIDLRKDYGSTWNGDVIIRDCDFVPGGGRHVSLIGGYNTGQHDFGYTCYMPERITIDTLRIDDSNHPDNYNGPAVFSNLNPKMKDADYVEKYPVVRTREVILKNISTASGKPLRVSDNPVMFKDVEVKRINE